MSNLLDQYLKKQQELSLQIKADSLPQESLIVFQELNYRICVLETFKTFCKTAPVTTDTNVMVYHYQIVDAYIRFLGAERKFGLKADAEGQAKRETAAAALERVIQDGRKRFASFKADTQDQYRDCIGSLISTVLPVWVQYRNTYINIIIGFGENSGTVASDKPEAKPKAKPTERIPETVPQVSAGNETASIELTQEEKFQKALTCSCPITKYNGKTLGDVLTMDPNALKWLATKFKGDAVIIDAAKTICEYALSA